MRLRLLARTSPSLATSRRFAVMNVGRRAGGGACKTQRSAAAIHRRAGAFPRRRMTNGVGSRFYCQEGRRLPPPDPSASSGEP